jgi:hypothetical protein
MKIQHIEVDEIPGFPALAERFDVDLSPDADYVRDQLSDLWYDCDHVKVGGEEGRGNHMFVTCDVDDIKFIIHYDMDDSDEAIALIDWWLDGAKGDLIGKNGMENTWSDWDKVQTGVAYRGGSGYCYGLYAKELGEFA